MMTYELFKEVVQKRIKEFLPHGFCCHKIVVEDIYKDNNVHDCMTLQPDLEGVGMICPRIYLDEWYEDFCVLQDLDEILYQMAMIIVEYSAITKEDPVFDIENKLDKIVMNVVHTEKNMEFLKLVPHREILDLSVFYRIIMHKGEDGYDTLLVTHGIAEELGLSEEDLFNISTENTKNLFPLKIITMKELTLGVDADIEEAWEDIKGSKYPFIVTNQSCLHGAAYLTHEDEMKKIADSLGKNYYAIPSSVNEFFIIPEGHSTERELKIKHSMEAEALSPNIYYYDRNLNKLKIA